MHRRTEAPATEAAERMRLDKWLWAARFFKTRQLAIDAINGGKVHVNGQRTKPGKEIGIGTQLSITKEPYAWDITIANLRAQRRPAPEAALLYVETAESLAKRQEEAGRRREERDLGIPADSRPNKRERRQIHRFKRPEG
ncbi:MAG: RNA-binding protein [Methylococcaceae bacterium]|nr:RNA-binding protein [Methylococcaceae bacterium]